MRIFVVMYRTFKPDGSLQSDTPIVALSTEEQAYAAIAGHRFDFEMTATEVEKLESLPGEYHVEEIELVTDE
jgi:hypothetical protein